MEQIRIPKQIARANVKCKVDKILEKIAEDFANFKNDFIVIKSSVLATSNKNLIKLQEKFLNAEINLVKEESFFKSCAEFYKKADNEIKDSKKRYSETYNESMNINIKF